MKKVFFCREKKEHLTIVGITKLRQMCAKLIKTEKQIKEIEDIVHRLPPEG